MPVIWMLTWEISSTHRQRIDTRVQMGPCCFTTLEQTARGRQGLQT
jgi:hypothetical protein